MVQRRNSKIKRTLRLMKFNIFLYLNVMLGLFPLFFLNQYEKIGTLKYTLFWYSSLIFLGISATLILINGVGILRDKKGSGHIVVVGKKRFYALELSFMDRAILVYGGCVLLSFVFSDFKEFALNGADGWQMGFYAQLIFIGIYFVLSRYSTWIEAVLGIHFLASGLVFLLGILHRFDIDPMGMYPGLSVLQKQEFLSTIGQATWYSSYVCTVFILGVLIFYFGKKPLYHLGGAAYTILSFATLVTQNSDSAFLAIAGVMLLLGLFSFSEPGRLSRFLQVMAFMWGTFGCMGIFQKIFAHRMIPLDNLSLFFSQSPISWICLILSVMGYIALERMGEEKVLRWLPLLKKIYIGFLITIAVMIIGVLLFIFLNTKGYLLQWFGYQTHNLYFYFDYHWGNNRGSTWMIAWQQFKEMPLLNKLFGVGPDCFSAYLYSVEEAKKLLESLWGSLTLTNAHNEYLNHLICYGIGGLAAWLTVLIGGIRYFYIKAQNNPYLIGAACCIIAYSCHNFFCYQQVCCTPILFIIMGLAEGLTKWGKSPTIIKNKNRKKRKA